jgi:hypothetical protein
VVSGQGFRNDRLMLLKETNSRQRGALSLIKITIATPAFGEVFYTPYVQSLFRLMRAFQQRRWESTFGSIAYADIAESRNFLLTHWFDKTDATHLLFIDADMGFPAQLVLDMVEFGQPLVGVVYPKRQIDIERIAEAVAAGEPARRAIARGHDYIIRKKRGLSISSPRKGFMQVDGCGAGVFLVARTAIETMLKKLPEINDTRAKTSSPLAANLDRLIRAFEPVRVDGALLSEDFSFCHRWKLCGGEVWVNTAHPVEHIGLHRFSGNYADLQPATTSGKVEIIKVSEQGADSKPRITQRVKIVSERKPK